MKNNLKLYILSKRKEIAKIIKEDRSCKICKSK